MNGSLVNKIGRAIIATCHSLNMLGQGVALLDNVALLKEVCHYGGRLWNPPSRCLSLQSSSVYLWNKMENSQLLQHHACLYAAMLPAIMIMVWTSEPVGQPQLNVVLIRVALVMVSFHSSKTLRHCHPQVFANAASIWLGHSNLFHSTVSFTKTLLWALGSCQQQV